MGDAGEHAALREELAAGLEGDARRARLALVDHLLTQGVTAGELRVAHDQGRLALLPLERLLRAEGNETVEEIAARFGVDSESLIRTRRALGLPVERGAPI